MCRMHVNPEANSHTQTHRHTHHTHNTHTHTQYFKHTSEINNSYFSKQLRRFHRNNKILFAGETCQGYATITGDITEPCCQVSSVPI